MRKNGVLGLLAILLVIGFICCDDEDNDPETYTVTFDLEGGNINGDTNSIKIIVKSGEKLNDFPNDPINNNGDTFGGWFTQKNGLGEEFKTSSKVNSNIFVYADWLYDGEKTITIKGLEVYNGNYGYIVLRHDNKAVAGTDPNLWTLYWEYISIGEFTSNLYDPFLYDVNGNNEKWLGYGDYNLLLIISTINGENADLLLREDTLVNIPRKRNIIIDYNKYNWINKLN